MILAHLLDIITVLILKLRVSHQRQISYLYHGRLCWYLRMRVVILEGILLWGRVRVISVHIVELVVSLGSLWPVLHLLVTKIEGILFLIRRPLLLLDLLFL
jgi:hypothetical protein